MARRRTIGVNPLSLPPPGAMAPGPSPLDVLIPKTGGGEAEPARAPIVETAVEAEPEPVRVAVPAPVPGAPLDDGEPPVEADGAERAELSVAVRPIAVEPDPVVPIPVEAEPVLEGLETGVLRTERASAVLDPGDHPPLSDGPAPGQYLVFEAGGESLAISILDVREIVEYGLVTRVPLLPRPIRGVTNLRGSIVPVVDLAVRLGLTPKPRSPHTCIVVVEACFGGQPSVVGIVADAVSAVRDLARDDVSPTPAFGSKLTVDAFAGLGRSGDQLLPVLDPARMLSGLDFGTRQGSRR